MAFGKRVNIQQEEDSVTHISDTQGAIDVDDDVEESNAPSASQTTRSSESRSRQKPSEEKDANKPLDTICFCKLLQKHSHLHDLKNNSHTIYSNKQPAFV